MKIRVFPTAQVAATYVAALTEKIVESRSTPVLGLATGETVIPYYRALVELAACGLDLSRTQTFNLDEYVGLSRDHPQSYHAFMQHYLFGKVNLHPDRTFIPDGMAQDLPAECRRYETLLQTHPADLQVLGIGMNGHIGFNEPGNELEPQTHVVELSPTTISRNARYFNRFDEMPTRAITMGVQSILRAHQIILMAFGEDKASIVAKTYVSNVTADIPASILHLHPNVTMVLDRDSAKHLPLFRETRGEEENSWTNMLLEST